MMKKLSYWHQNHLEVSFKICVHLCKCKGRVQPRAFYEGRGGEWWYRITLLLTSALGGVGGHCHTPVTLHMGKTWYTLCMRLDGPQGWSGWGQKLSPLLRFEPCAVQLIVAIPTTLSWPFTLCYIRNILGLCSNVELYWVRQCVLLCW